MARMPALLVAVLMVVPQLASHASAAPVANDASVAAPGEVSVLCVSRAGARVRLPSRADACATGEKTLALRPSRRRSLCLAADAVRRVGPGRCEARGGVLRRVPARQPVVLCAEGRLLTRVAKSCDSQARWTIRNHAPTDLSLRSNHLAAPLPAGGLVGAMSVVDVDRADHARYTLVGGDGDDHNSSFALDGALLRARSPLAAGVYSVRVRARDLLGRRTVGVFTVTVTGS